MKYRSHLRRRNQIPSRKSNPSRGRRATIRPTEHAQSLSPPVYRLSMQLLGKQICVHYTPYFGIYFVMNLDYNNEHEFPELPSFNWRTLPHLISRKKRKFQPPVVTTNTNYFPQLAVMLVVPSFKSILDWFSFLEQASFPNMDGKKKYLLLSMC